MAINFPDSPSDGDTTTLAGKTYTYDSSKSKWSPSGGITLAALSVGSEGTAAGDGGLAYSSGSGVFTFTPAVAGSAMTVYTGLVGIDGTPSGSTYIANVSSPSVGDMAFASDTGIVYVRSSTGWRKIATIQEAPTAVTNGDGSALTTSYPTAGASAHQDVALKITDPEGFPVTWSYAVSGGGVLSGTDINNSGGTKLASIAVQTAAATSGGATTITYRVTRNSSTDVAGAFTLTFTGTDTQSAGASQGAVAFTIEFIVINSQYTYLLLGAGATGTNNTFTDSSSTGHTVSVTGDPAQGSFSPYRASGVSQGSDITEYSPSSHGGSVGLDGSDYLDVSSHSDFTIGTSDYTLQAWVYLTAAPSSTAGLIDMRPATDAGNYAAVNITSDRKPQFYAGENSVILSATAITLNTWTHILYQRSGTTGSLYQDGVSKGVASDNRNYSATGVKIGGDGSFNSSGSNITGRIADVRVTTALDSTAAPTSPLTNITGTKLLLNMQNASVFDKSQNTNLTLLGNTTGSTTQAKFSGKSVYFDGTDDYIDTGTTMPLGSGDFSVELWAWNWDEKPYATGNASTPNLRYIPWIGTVKGNESGAHWRMGTLGDIPDDWGDQGNEGKLHFGTRTGSGGTTVKFGDVDYNDETWRHFAVTRNGTDLRAFCDGVQIGSTTTMNTDISGTDNNMTIGRTYDGAGMHHRGYLQDVRVTKGLSRAINTSGTWTYPVPTSALKG